MDIGLSQKTINNIVNIFKQFTEVEEAILYGLRAKGNFKPSSGIEVTLKGNKLNLTILSKIDTLIDDLLLPYKFDTSIYHQIHNEAFLKHIDRDGKDLYKIESYVI